MLRLRVAALGFWSCSGGRITRLMLWKPSLVGISGKFSKYLGIQLLKKSYFHLCKIVGQRRHVRTAK